MGPLYVRLQASQAQRLAPSVLAPWTSLGSVAVIVTLWDSGLEGISLRAAGVSQ